jgi:dTDP-glucose 4,6-dehydratase
MILCMSKVAIIGCNSFTGGYVVDELLAGGEHEVTGIDRQKKSEAFVPYLSRELANFRFFQMDLNQHLGDMITLLQSEQPDYIMNLAALSEVAPSWEHPEQWFQTNVVALTQLVDGIKGLASLRRFTQVSTPEVYGSCEGLVKEDYRMNPSTPYAASKAAFDVSLMTFVKNYRFPANFTRAANVYGPHQQLFKIIPRTFIYLKLGRKIPLHGGGAAVRSFTHVRDVAKAYIEVMVSGRRGHIYHISTDRMVQIRELVGMICKLLGKDMEDWTEVVPARPGHDAAYTLDWGKIRTELHWHPSIELDRGLREVHDWIEAYWKIIRIQPLEYVHQF